MLEGKNIILGITGSIAAYKAATLVRLFVKNRAKVKVVMTPYAKEFITPVTLATLSKNTVLCDFFRHDDGAWNSHVDLGIWADIMLIAPATANTIAKMANGICDNLLLTTYLSARCPVAIAPAMDYDMFRHPATLENLRKLKSFGNIIIDPADGELASGLEGKGRMEEPEKILESVAVLLQTKKKMTGKKFLVTAGPTFESIDAVRYIGNRSSGKMGYAVADELARRGADVVLISGPVAISPGHPSVKRIMVETAGEMYEETLRGFPSTDGAVMAAAISDFTPVSASSSKIKRGKNNLKLDLKPTTDIAAALGKIRKKGQLLVGFALETGNGKENAIKKLEKKNLDFIVLNSLNDKGAGFGFDTNKITIIHKDNKITEFELKSKISVAEDIADQICLYFDTPK
ncbi:MAG: bifunctional phosphopantothenoylcysteine decarboxylase/phosphopantothenate--cysteine ligase CoaBC [Bacteroidetes bacterium]|nr:bifunctional phosphopantothenoylcysteine decarboxylase/phosphopantothenate--cysteine ligase CoaBC [Bacteroidota bacterium]